MGPHFPAKCAKIAVLYSLFEPPGTLNTIRRIHRIQRKWATAGRTDPGFPTPGGRMTVVYTNSLKLSHPEYSPSWPYFDNPLMSGLLHVRIAKAPMDHPHGAFCNPDMKRSRHQATTGPHGGPMGAHGAPWGPWGPMGPYMVTPDQLPYWQLLCYHPGRGQHPGLGRSLGALGPLLGWICH